MDGDSEDDESDWEHAQDGQAPVGTVHGVPGYQGETQKDKKRKNMGKRPIAPQCESRTLC